MTLLRLDGIWKAFESAGEKVYAVNGVDLEIAEGATLGLIGESGSGKSTVGRIALGLLEPDEGSVRFDGRSLNTLSSPEMRKIRAEIQVVFQEPYEALNPRMTVSQIVSEPLRIHRRSLTKEDRLEKTVQTLQRVGLTADLTDRYPRELSGGQQQRVGVARAIVTNPKLVVLDEPTSSLDLSTRAQILDLLTELQHQLGLSYLFISHDLATVRAISHRVAVMYLGKIMEIGDAESVVRDPKHPYTKALLSATLSVDPSKQQDHYPLSGEIPSATDLPYGCVLYGRCPIQIEQCSLQQIPLDPVSERQNVACIRLGAGEAKRAAN